MAKRQRRYGNSAKLSQKQGKPAGAGGTGAADAAKIGQQTAGAAGGAPDSRKGPSAGIVTYEDVKKRYRFYFNIVAKRKIWFAVSALLILISAVSLVVQKPFLNLGMAFTQGTMISVTFLDMDTPSQQVVSDAIASVVTSSQVQPAVDRGRVIIRTSELNPEEIKALRAALEEKIGPIDPGTIQESTVGPTIGQELLQGALIALIIACVLMLGYMAFRFKFNFACAGVLALLHDILITIGIFSLIRWEIDPSFIAGVLTVFGYSINDKVVIFDRIRENEGLQKKGGSFEDLVDQSLWQTMARSINTGVVVLLALFAIFFLGGESTKTFSLAMIIGAAVGMYSSIFISSQFVIEFKKLGQPKLSKSN
ncbi:MAG: protein translocase subunit SecF [Peptococcaceae bacterium]|nr:protein translocase subunit SecF [Peptococcaceae bacterium]